MKRLFHSRESGQAITEYVLLLLIVSAVFLAVRAQFNTLDLTSKFTTLLTGKFTRAYQYGATDALGFDDGGPVHHPRAPNAQQEVRIFYVKNAN